MQAFALVGIPLLALVLWVGTMRVIHVRHRKAVLRTGTFDEAWRLLSRAEAPETTEGVEHLCRLVSRPADCQRAFDFSRRLRDHPKRVEELLIKWHRLSVEALERAETSNAVRMVIDQAPAGSLVRGLGVTKCLKLDSTFEEAFATLQIAPWGMRTKPFERATLLAKCHRDFNRLSDEMGGGINPPAIDAYKRAHIYFAEECGDEDILLWYLKEEELGNPIYCLAYKALGRLIAEFEENRPSWGASGSVPCF